MRGSRSVTVNYNIGNKNRDNLLQKKLMKLYYIEETFFIDWSMFKSGPGKGVATANEPRSSMIVFYIMTRHKDKFNYLVTVVRILRDIKLSI